MVQTTTFPEPPATAQIRKGDMMQDPDINTRCGSELLIRTAALNDLEIVSLLLGDLGYPFDPSRIKGTFERLLDDPQVKILVAVIRQQVVGMVTLLSHTALRLNGGQITIEEFVVHPNYRGLGIGKELMAAVDRYAEVSGAVRIELKTNDTRPSFKRGFYEKSGFVRAEHAAVYRRDISS